MFLLHLTGITIDSFGMIAAREEERTMMKPSERFFKILPAVTWSNSHWSLVYILGGFRDWNIMFSPVIGEMIKGPV